MNTINIGILAHVDAGKTSLTEYILYETGVKKEIGSVDKGNTSTDSMPLEKQRGITIKASPISVNFDGIKINIIDTPGHSDFISEVERSITILDCAILVISAVEGIQAQTKFIFNILKNMKIPTIIFINKIDRMGSNYFKVLNDLDKTMSLNFLPLNNIKNEGEKNCLVERIPIELNKMDILNIVSLVNEELIELFINDKLSYKKINQELNNQIKSAQIYPIYAGAAVQGKGVKDLLKGIKALTPLVSNSNDKKLSALIFKVEISEDGLKRAFFKVLSGTLKVRDNITVFASNGVVSTIKVKKICSLVNGSIIQSEEILVGDIGVIYDPILQIGDFLGCKPGNNEPFRHSIPNLETSIVPDKKEDIYKLYDALLKMSEEDPLIQIFKDKVENHISVRLFGEVQKEIIQSTLFEKYEIKVHFTETSVIYKERPIKNSTVIYEIGDSNNPFYATVGLTIEPNDSGVGIDYKVTSEWGALPQAFYNAIKETIMKTLKQGLHGWEVEGIKVTLTHADYISPISTASDYRNLTPLVVMEALQKSGVRVLEPINSFVLHTPVKFSNKSISTLLKIGADITEQKVIRDTSILSGFIGVKGINKIKNSIKDITEGEGLFLTEPFSYREIINSKYPSKKFNGISPLHRKEYLLSIFKGLKK